jgi:CDP-ribitol ribitolphosphotransferase / teichoic acid ribitol-phosphate polymerase
MNLRTERTGTLTESVITQISWARVHLTLTASVDLSALQAAPPMDPAEDEVPIEVRNDALVIDADAAGLVVDSDADDPAAVPDDDGLAASLEGGTDAEAEALAALEPAAGELAARAPGEPDVVFKLTSGKRQLAIPTRRVEAGTYQLDINVINFRSRRQIPEGTWRIAPYVAGKRAPAVGFALDQADVLAGASRTFLYDRNRVSYIISFGLSEDDEPALLMRVYQMFRRIKPEAPKSKPPLAVSLRRRLLPISRRVKAANQWYALAHRLRPPTGNRILFASEARSSMGGNLLRIRDRMVERGLDKQYVFRYSFRVPHTVDKWGTLRVIYLLATSDIVLIDDYFGMLEPLKISSKTKIIQAWHAGSGFKNIGYSRFGNYGSPKLSNAHRKYTYALTGSKHLIPVYAEAFGIEESAVIPTGLPRIDTFLDPVRTEALIQKFRDDYPHLAGKKIILFAPTFRGRGNQNAYYDYDRINFGQFYDLCGEDTVVLFRMHHFILKPVPIPTEYRDRLFDFSHFPDTNDLLHVTDILVTDYSSIIYEFALLDRPMLFLAYDKEIYSATRGFHRDYDQTAPGKVCNTFDELIKALRAEDYDLWKIDEFRRENFDAIDTHAADRVIDWLILGQPPRRDATEAAPSSIASAAPAEPGVPG